MLDVRLSGAGIISCYGGGLPPAVEKIHAGRSGSSVLSGFELPGGETVMVNQMPQDLFTRDAAGIIDMCCQTIDQAVDQAGYTTQAILQDEECALIIGAGGFLFVAEAEIRRQRIENTQEVTPIYSPGWAGRQIMARYGMRGMQFTISTACSSSANAILLAYEMLKAGECKRALVVGAEGLCAITLSGFQSLMLLARDGCRPFDKNRQGLQLGEGIASLLLESAPTAPGNACYIAGGANLCDTYHLTSATPSGSVMRDVMQQALVNSGLTADAINLVKIHGVGSRDSDAAEAAALHSVFGHKVPPLVGMKPYIGHTLAASGALETALLSTCLQNNFVPATAGFDLFDEALALTPLRKNMPASGVKHVLMNYFGFGGNYTSLVLRNVA